MHRRTFLQSLCVLTAALAAPTLAASATPSRPTPRAGYDYAISPISGNRAVCVITFDHQYAARFGEPHPPVSRDVGVLELGSYVDVYEGRTTVAYELITPPWPQTAITLSEPPENSAHQSGEYARPSWFGRR